MDRPIRLIEMLQLLGGRRSWRPADIADRFGISERTAYRDLQDLSRLQCIPITRDEDGYRLVEGATIRWLGLTSTERATLKLLLQHPAFRTASELMSRLEGKLDAATRELEETPAGAHAGGPRALRRHPEGAAAVAGAGGSRTRAPVAPLSLVVEPATDVARARSVRRIPSREHVVPGGALSPARRAAYVPSRSDRRGQAPRRRLRAAGLRPRRLSPGDLGRVPRPDPARGRRPLRRVTRAAHPAGCASSRRAHREAGQRRAAVPRRHLSRRRDRPLDRGLRRRRPGRGAARPGHTCRRDRRCGARTATARTSSGRRPVRSRSAICPACRRPAMSPPDNAT